MNPIELLLIIKLKVLDNIMFELGFIIISLILRLDPKLELSVLPLLQKI